MNLLAKSYVQKNFNKKLGKKKISATIKETIKLLFGNSVQNYSKFLLIKPVTIENNHNLFLSDNFNEFFPPIKHNNNYPQFLINPTNSIEHLDSQIAHIIKLKSRPSNNM